MNKTQSKTNRYIIFALFLLSPIFAVFNIPGKLAIVSILFILSLFYYFRFRGMKVVLKSYPIKIWFILTIFHWCNAIYNNVPGVDIIDLLHGLKIFSCICVFTYLGRADFNGTVKNLLICFTIYLLLSFLVNDISSSELDGRMSGVIYSTGLGQTAALTGFYIAYFSLKNRISIIKTILLYILPITVILLTQSRNSLAMLLICLFGHLLAYAYINKINFFKLFIFIGLASIISFMTLQVVLEKTALGARLKDTEKAEQMNTNNDRLTGTILDDITGDRLVYYVRGWEFFKESPITGIGMWNYRYKSQGIYPLHSEYMVHLCEGGIVGILIWLLFVVLLLRSIYKSKQLMYIKIIAYSSIISILFCGIYARLFFYEFFYPIIGLALSMIYYNKRLYNNLG